MLLSCLSNFFLPYLLIRLCCVAVSRTLEHLLRITLAGWDGCYYSETFQHDKFPFFSSASNKLRLLLIPAITQQSNSVSDPLLPSYHVLSIQALYSIVWQWMWINDIVPREAKLFARNFLLLSQLVCDIAIGAKLISNHWMRCQKDTQSPLHTVYCSLMFD